MPLGAASYANPANLRWLTSEQALADYADLLAQLKSSLGVPAAAPVIAFGGSYGGMLAGWMRIKYPDTIAGAIAASAPVLQFTGVTPPSTFNDIVTATFRAANPGCPDGIRRSWDIMRDLGASAAGRQSLMSTFQLCDAQPLTSQGDVTNFLYQWINGALGYLAMADYPVPASFLGPMPAYPVNVACAGFPANSGSPAAVSNATILAAMKAAMTVFYNYTGACGCACFNVTSNQPSTLGSEDGWNYQSCTEMVMPIGQSGVSDMFWPAPWNLTATIQSCQQQFGTTPLPNFAITHYGGPDFSSASNIVWSNGNLDPWSGGGVLHVSATAAARGVQAVIIEGGAHHLDLRGSNPADPPSVLAARDLERAAIRSWIAGVPPAAPADGDSSLSAGWVAVIAFGAALFGAGAVLVYQRMTDSAGADGGSAAPSYARAP
jgi:lysosomal Pro-X carboxypeptidase